MRRLRTEADLPHGTEHCYIFYQCRCDDCREAKRESMRKYRARQKAARIGCTHEKLRRNGGGPDFIRDECSKCGKQFAVKL